MQPIYSTFILIFIIGMIITSMLSERLPKQTKHLPIIMHGVYCIVTAITIVVFL